MNSHDFRGTLVTTLLSRLAEVPEQGELDYHGASLSGGWLPQDHTLRWSRSRDPGTRGFGIYCSKPPDCTLAVCTRIMLSWRMASRQNPSITDRFWSLKHTNGDLWWVYRHQMVTLGLMRLQFALRQPIDPLQWKL